MTVQYSLECFAEHSDEPVQLAKVRAEAVPRVGDFVTVYDKQLRRRDDHYPTIFKVTSVAWELHVDEKDGDPSVEASCSVIVEPESAHVVFYCVCEMTEMGHRPAVDDKGICDNCGRERA